MEGQNGKCDQAGKDGGGTWEVGSQASDSAFYLKTIKP